MADKKISQLTAASTPLAGTEVLPIVQSNTTKKVSVADLTAGRAVAMAGGSFTDNITQSTAAKGVNFTANTSATGMTSQLLNWYEEGSYTATMLPTTSGTITLANTHNTLAYTRIGRMVAVTGMLMVDTVGSPVGAINVNLPFTAGSGNLFNSAAALFINGSNGPLSADFIGIVSAGTSTLTIYLGDGNYVQSDSANAMQASTQTTIALTYFV